MCAAHSVRGGRITGTCRDKQVTVARLMLILSILPHRTAAQPAHPKSAIFTLLMSPGRASSRFSSFKSRCTTPLHHTHSPKALCCSEV